MKTIFVLIGSIGTKYMIEYLLQGLELTNLLQMLILNAWKKKLKKSYDMC